MKSLAWTAPWVLGKVYHRFEAAMSLLSRGRENSREPIESFGGGTAMAALETV